MTRRRVEAVAWTLAGLLVAGYGIAGAVTRSAPQFTQQTWLAYGGGQYASSANLASPSEQVAVAGRVLAGQGIGAWPVCGRNG